MSKILKDLREKADMTQEEAAEKLEVSVNTLQNWERDDRTGMDSLKKLFAVYGTKKEDADAAVLAIFHNGDEESAEQEPYNFPDFLFEGDSYAIQKAKKVRLNEEEMEIFAYFHHLQHGYQDDYDEGHGFFDGFNEVENFDGPIDYMFLKDHGGYYRTMSLANDVRSKAKGFEDIIDRFGIEHPGASFALTGLPTYEIIDSIYEFSEHSCVGTRLLTLCKAAQTPLYICSTNPNKENRRFSEEDDYIRKDGFGELGQFVYRVIKGAYVDYLHEDRVVPRFRDNTGYLYKRCLTITKKESEDPVYLAAKKQYVSKLNSSKEYPYPLTEIPDSFQCHYDYYLELTDTGRKFLDWYGTPAEWHKQANEQDDDK